MMLRRCDGAWLSLVERSVRDREVVGSNPIAPTNQITVAGAKRLPLFLASHLSRLEQIPRLDDNMRTQCYKTATAFQIPTNQLRRTRARRF